MTGNDRVTTREEKLAAKLRENLKRRKAQVRAQCGPGPQVQSESDPLPNPVPKS